MWWLAAIKPELTVKVGSWQHRLVFHKTQGLVVGIVCQQPNCTNPPWFLGTIQVLLCGGVAAECLERKSEHPDMGLDSLRTGLQKAVSDLGPC